MSAEVPKLKKAALYNRIATLNRPFSEDPAENPLAAPHLFIRTENAGLVEWAERISANLEQGLGGSGNDLTIDTKVFQNSFLAAYDLIGHGYGSSGLELPAIATPPDHYTWLGFGSSPTILELFDKYNERQREIATEYPDYLEALQTWAGESVMAFTTSNRVGMTAIAGAEVYLSFRDHQEPAAA